MRPPAGRPSADDPAVRSVVLECIQIIRRDAAEARERRARLHAREPDTDTTDSRATSGTGSRPQPAE